MVRKDSVLPPSFKTLPPHVGSVAPRQVAAHVWCVPIIGIFFAFPRECSWCWNWLPLVSTTKPPS